MTAMATIPCREHGYTGARRFKFFLDRNLKFVRAALPSSRSTSPRIHAAGVPHGEQLAATTSWSNDDLLWGMAYHELHHGAEQYDASWDDFYGEDRPPD
jgi:hypothetical protein